MLSAMDPSQPTRPAPRVEVLTSSTRNLLPWLVAVAFFMESLDTTILNTAVPVIAKALSVTPLAMKAVLASYTLALAIFIPISGWMADRFGTRHVFSAAIGIFTLGSLLCGISTNIHELVFCRVLQGCGGAMMVPVGRLTLVRAFAKHELVRVMSFVSIPALIGPMLGPVAGGLIVDYLHWRIIFFLNIPIGLLGLVMVYLHLPDYREQDTPPLDLLGLILFGSGVALLSWVLEVFGDHTLSVREIISLLAISSALLVGYWLHAKETPFPLLRLAIFRLRTFSAAVGGGFITRLGIGGVPFLLPLLYQIGLGYTPVESGLLIMPQAIAAMVMNACMTRLLNRFGYRSILISNTVIIGILLVLFATIGLRTPLWVIVLLAFLYGAFSTLQYTSMNTLVYADVGEEDTSAASTIFATMQQMALSFGVAIAGLATAFFLPEHTWSMPVVFIHGIHEAFVALGILTVVSTVVFRNLRRRDGLSISRQKLVHAG
ncbi:MAG TPA: DHA2 family efflux MFS transporter permease subunit [Acidobacteriaceae bacterium]|nr:DHA2 family efflux MFS transporter permease subunit [Acidobacteriaceae bacterium]